MRELAFVALGSNVGAREHFLEVARRSLALLPGTRVVAQSQVEETAALTADGSPQPPYLNQMIALETSLSPEALLAQLQQIEIASGRRREVRWGSRTLDLDIVLFGQRRVNTSDLVIPHPELPSRDFWRRELGELGVDP
jgi:2-amino-4-hydroxy-6-hydroxymethyldihydropteridine diphosphokinase